MRHLPIKRVISLAAGILLGLWVLVLMIHMQGASQAALHSAARDRAQALVAYAARDMRRWIKEDKESELERLAQDLAAEPEILDATLYDARGIPLAQSDQAVPLDSLLPIGGQHIGLSSFELMRDAVLDGLGWAVLPSPLIQSQLRQGELLTLKHKFSLQWRDYGVYLSENAHHGKVLAWLKKAIEAYLEPFE